MAEALAFLTVVLLLLLLWQEWRLGRGLDGDPPTLNTRNDQEP